MNTMTILQSNAWLKNSTSANITTFGKTEMETEDQKLKARQGHCSLMLQAYTVEKTSSTRLSFLTLRPGKSGP